MNVNYLPFEKLKLWSIKIDFCNTIASVKISGDELTIKDNSKSKIIFLNYNSEIKFVKIFENKVILNTFPAFLKIYYRLFQNSILISNVYSELILKNEKVLLNKNVFLQNLSGVNYPNDNLFEKINLFESSSIYEFNNKIVIFLR